MKKGQGRSTCLAALYLFYENKNLAQRLSTACRPSVPDLGWGTSVPVAQIREADSVVEGTVLPRVGLQYPQYLIMPPIHNHLFIKKYICASCQEKNFPGDVFSAHKISKFSTRVVGQMASAGEPLTCWTDFFSNPSSSPIPYPAATAGNFPLQIPAQFGILITIYQVNSGGFDPWAPG